MEVWKKPSDVNIAEGLELLYFDTHKVLLIYLAHERDRTQDGLALVPAFV